MNYITPPILISSSKLILGRFIIIEVNFKVVNRIKLISMTPFRSNLTSDSKFYSYDFKYKFYLNNAIDSNNSISY